MPIFDTHHYVKKLEASGLDPKQAEAQVEFQAEILSTIIDNTIVTKENLKDTSNELKAEITEVRTELKAEIAEVKT
jgi:hypothetical protein